MEKKKLTTRQKQTKYRALQYGCYAGMGVSVIAPFVIIGAINFDEWFLNNPDGYKIGIGAAIGAMVTAIAIFLVTQKKEKDLKVTDMWITLIVCWFAIFFGFKLMADIYTEIFTIGMWTGLGLCSAFGFDMASKVQKEKADAYKRARASVAEKNIEEQAKKEVQEEQATE